MLFRDSFLISPARSSTEEFETVLPFFELALVLVRFDHVASRIVNADHSIM